MIKDYVGIAFINLKRRRKRTLLTLIGIFIGIAAVVALISLGQGLNAVIREQFEMMGIDKILIYPKGSFFGLGASSKLTEDDMNFLSKIKGVKISTGMLFKNARIEYKDEVKYRWVVGMPQDESRKVITDMEQFKIKEGRDIEKGDKRKAVITKYFREGKIFDSKVKIGEILKIQSTAFEVIGVLDELGNPDDDSTIYIGLDDAREIFNEPNELQIIYIEIQKGTDTGEIAEKIKRELRKFRNVKKGEEDFVVQTAEELKETYSGIFDIVVAVFIGIAAISLVVGGIGIMNTMYTSVLERTREIGIMKAVGARNSQILALFLIESGMLGLVGGIIGIALGIGLAELVIFGAAQAGITMLKVYFPPYLILGSLAFSFLVGVISGVMPARKAAMLKPVDALRYE
jgi:putative ABC transport system permease protein